jgi:hypothetical protein
MALKREGLSIYSQRGFHIFLSEHPLCNLGVITRPWFLENIVRGPGEHPFLCEFEDAHHFQVIKLVDGAIRKDAYVRIGHPHLKYGSAPSRVDNWGA